MIVRYNWRFTRPSKAMIRVNMYIVDEESHDVPVRAGHFFMTPAQWMKFIACYETTQAIIAPMTNVVGLDSVKYEFIEMS